MGMDNGIMDFRPQVSYYTRDVHNIEPYTSRRGYTAKVGVIHDPPLRLPCDGGVTPPKSSSRLKGARPTSPSDLRLYAKIQSIFDRAFNRLQIAGNRSKKFAVVKEELAKRLPVTFI